MSTLEERREARRRRRAQQDENQNEEPLSGEAEMRLSVRRQMRADRLSQIAEGVSAISGEDEYERKRRERREARLLNHVGDTEEPAEETTSRHGRHRHEEETEEETPQVEESSTTPEEDEAARAEREAERIRKNEEARARQRKEEQEEEERAAAEEERKLRQAQEAAEAELRRQREEKEAEERRKREEKEAEVRRKKEEIERQRKEEEDRIRQEELDKQECDYVDEDEEEEQEEEEEEEADTTHLGPFDDATASTHTEITSPQDSTSMTYSQDQIKQETEIVKSPKDIWHEREIDSKMKDTNSIGSKKDSKSVSKKNLSPASVIEEGGGRLHSRVSMFESKTATPADSKKFQDSENKEDRSDHLGRWSVSELHISESGKEDMKNKVLARWKFGSENQNQMRPEFRKKFEDFRGPTRNSVGKIASKFTNNNDMNKKDNNIARSQKQINASNWQNTLRGSSRSTSKPPTVRHTSKELKVTSRWQPEQLSKSKTPPKVPLKTQAVKQRSLATVTKLSSKWEHGEPKESRNYKKVPLEHAVTVESVSNLASKWQNHADTDELPNGKNIQSQNFLKKQRSLESVSISATRRQQPEPTGNTASTVQQNRPLSASMTETRQKDLSETPASPHRPVQQTVLEGHELSSSSQTEEEEDRKRMEEEEVRMMEEEVTRKKKKKGKRKGLGGLSPEKKKMLKDESDENGDVDDDSDDEMDDLEQEDLDELEEKHRVLQDRVKPLPEDFDSMNEADLKKLCKQLHDKVTYLEEEVYDWEVKIRKQEFEINELTLKVNDTKGKFAKPVLRKVNKTESKFEKLHKKEKQSDFRNQLKSTGQSKFTLEEESKEPKTPDWKDNLKKAEKVDGEEQEGGEEVAAES